MQADGAAKVKQSRHLLLLFFCAAPESLFEKSQTNTEKYKKEQGPL
jgi:hypothetical protein